MSKEKLISMFKSMRIISIVLGAALIILGIIKLFFKANGSETDPIAFGVYACIGLFIALFGYLYSSKVVLENEEKLIVENKKHDEGF